jgi:hypothetical protein
MFVVTPVLSTACDGGLDTPLCACKLRWNWPIFWNPLFRN